MEMKMAPLGACATWTLPPGLHTKSPAPTLPSESSSDPSSMKVCSSAVCSCKWHDRAGRHPEQDSRASFVVPVQDLHLYSVELRSLPRHRRRGDEGRPKFARVD